MLTLETYTVLFILGMRVLDSLHLHKLRYLEFCCTFYTFLDYDVPNNQTLNH